MQRKFIAILLSVVFAVTAEASAQPLLSDCRFEFSLDTIEGMRPREKGETPQGMAIHNGTMFTLYHGGSCVVTDIDTQKLLGEFTIDSAQGTHCNNASFGPANTDSPSQFPLLYVSECFAPCRCFVEEVTTGGSHTVATIIYTGSGIDSFCDWCTDRENRHIYAYGRTPERGVVLKRFALPTPDDADENGIIELGDSDILEEFVYPAGVFVIAQGSYISDGRIYLPTGVPAKSDCFIHVLSLNDGRHIDRIDISDLGLEPEGLCIHDGRLWQFFGGGNGTLYSFGLSHREEKL